MADKKLRILRMYAGDLDTKPYRTYGGSARRTVIETDGDGYMVRVYLVGPSGQHVFRQNRVDSHEVIDRLASIHRELDQQLGLENVDGSN